MSFFSFLLFGHVCLVNPGELDHCWNFHSNPPVYYVNERLCTKAAKDYLYGAQAYYRRQGLSISEIELYCIPTNHLDS
jgi:hypothetical protein